MLEYVEPIKDEELSGPNCCMKGRYSVLPHRLTIYEDGVFYEKNYSEDGSYAGLWLPHRMPTDHQNGKGNVE